MTKFESKIRNHANAGNTVLVEVRPIYNGDNLVPDKIAIFAIDQIMNVIVDTEIDNGLRQNTICCN